MPCVVERRVFRDDLQVGVLEGGNTSDSCEAKLPCYSLDRLDSDFAMGGLDRSRIAYAEVLPNETKEAAAAFMRRALGWFSDAGIEVERVMTDNGSAYRSRLFRSVLEAAGIKHKRTRPYRPQTNGKVGRFNLTLKHEWAYAAPYDSNQARLDDLEIWLHYYNHHRANMAHDGGVPMSVVNNVCGKHS